MASSLLQMCLVSALVRSRHDMIESPLDADKMCATPSPGRVEFEVNDGLDCLAFEVDAGVNWDPMVIQPLLHAGKDLPLMC